MKYILMFLVSALALGEQPRAHAEAAITLHLNAAPATVLPLFGPIREAEWAHGWNPAILYPTDRVQKPGAVFTTGKPGKETFWIMTAYDETGYRVSYAVIEPEVAAEQLEIVLTPFSGGSATQAVVTHRWTALSEEANPRVREWAREFPGQRDHWEHAINQRLQELLK
jgi:hypothetical protein